MTPGPQNPSEEDLLAHGGGHATAAGVSFQASVGAIFATQLITERKLDDRLNLGDAAPRSIRFETEAPLDDILVATNESSWIFVQAKTTLSLSDSLDSELGKTADQIVRQWLSCANGSGQHGWDRPLVFGRDRMVIAVGRQASGTVANDLAMALASTQVHSTAPLSQAQQNALQKLSALLVGAWTQITGTAPQSQDVDDVLRFLTILQFDLQGPDRVASIETLTHLAEDASTAPAAFTGLESVCEDLMVRRQGADATQLRRTLARTGLRLRAAPSYQADVKKLRAYSARVQARLDQYEETKVAGVPVKIERQCTTIAVAAAKAGSLVLVGEPGAGKSALINATAERLRGEGREVIELAVDGLPVESLDGLSIQLDLQHALRHVLENWPGVDTAFLFIDALDATRGGKSEAVFRAVISDVLSLPDSRWHVIASIRTFDLRLGQQFRELFAGTPPDPDYADPAFANVCHLHVPRWTDQELAELLTRAPALATAIERGGERLHDLARVPFNTRLLADLINGGLAAEAFGEVRSQVELLALYWQHRVDQHGTGAELCLRAAVAQMVANRALQAGRLATAEPDPAAFDGLLRSSVLVPVFGDRYVSFRHHILFDYAASRVFIDPTNIMATGELLRQDRALGLMLAPALSFALHDLWEHGTNGHPEFWLAVAQFAGDSASDPIARSVAARSACELPATSNDMRGFLDLLAASGPTQALTFRAFSHIVGAFTVRIDDNQPVDWTPWCHLAGEASRYVAELVWPLRTLLFQLVPRAQEPDQRNALGRASRAILEFALNQPTLSSQITAVAIGFVADTYVTDPDASRRLLQYLIAPDRLRDHAHEDMPWLARKVKPISDVDPAFVTEIYRTVFAFAVTDDTVTQMGSSQILPLMSNRRQDYEAARFELMRAFPGFLRSHPTEAIRALVAALEGYVATDHPLERDAQEQIVRVGQTEARFIEDRSHIWAWNPDDQHPDNAVSLVKAFVARLGHSEE